MILSSRFTIMRQQLTRNNRITFSVPEGADAKKLPVYSGKILVSGSNGEELGIPYFGQFIPPQVPDLFELMNL